MKLAIGLATRGRPELLARTLEVTLSNIEQTDTELLVLADRDDKVTREAFGDLLRTFPGVCFVDRERPSSLGAKYNHILSRYADVYLAMVDYAPHVTKGFDTKILEAASIYSDGYAIIYNHYANLSFPGINAATRKMTDAMGGLFPPYYPYWFVDHHVDDIGHMTGRIVFADVTIDTSKREENETKTWTQGQRDTWLWALLFDALSPERQQTALRIIDLLDEKPERKAALRNNIRMHAKRSMMVNGQARRMVGSDRSTDAWYERVKATGMAKLASVSSAQQMAWVENTFKDIAEQLAAQAA